MKDLKQLIIKIVISAIILIIAFLYLEKPPVNAIHFDISKPSDTTATPSQLKWHDPFKGIENVPSKPKSEPK